MRLQRFVTTTLGLFALSMVLPWVGRPVLGQDKDEADKPEVTLKVGDKAPPVKIEKWVKGSPVSGFEKGKVYVVEFWATWCGPCIASMPHLTALQKEYQDKGVTIIGVNVWERKYDADTSKKVQDFVKEQGDRMVYTVAYDGGDKPTDLAYMKAAGQDGVPTAFLIDKNGKIAWYGHPMWLDLPLEAVVADKWDPKTGPEKIVAAQKQLREVEEKLPDDPKAAVAAWDRFEREYPGVAHTMTNLAFSVLLRGGEYERAYKLGAKLVDEAIAGKDANGLNEIAWTIVDPEGKVEKKDVELALKAATKADELSKHENPAIIDTLARVYFVKGDAAKAVELETKAVNLAEGQLKEDLQTALDEFKAAQAKKK